MEGQPPTRHRLQNAIVPSLATALPVHDYPHEMTKTNCRDLDSVENNKSDEHHGSVAPSTPQESWVDVALMVLLGLVIAALSMVLQIIVLAYYMYMIINLGCSILVELSSNGCILRACLGLPMPESLSPVVRRPLRGDDQNHPRISGSRSPPTFLRSKDAAFPRFPTSPAVTSSPGETSHCVKGPVCLSVLSTF